MVKRIHMGGSVEKTEKTYAILDTNGEVEMMFPSLRDLLLFLGRALPTAGNEWIEMAGPGSQGRSRDGDRL